MNLRKAAEQALEALESLDCGDTYKTHNAASALRQALADEVLADREQVAQWMIERGFATGHGDSIADLLKEIEWQIESRTKQAYCDGLENGLDAEREACAKVCENMERNGAWITKAEAAAAIRARGEK